VKAFEIIKSELPDARLWLVGRGPLEARLRRALPEGAEMLGYLPREEFYERMARAHCLLVPSVREGWGLVVLEANSVGTPAVGYDVPGVRESIRHEDTGLLAVAGEPPSLAHQALVLVTDEGRLRHFGLQGTKWSASFSWHATADRLMAVIHDHANGRPSGVHESPPPAVLGHP
jgi:glycosyltransferase involved in cell wall biosynthesis